MRILLAIINLMIYLFIDAHNIKLLDLKKTMLGQQETYFFAKKHEAQLLNNGKVVNVDLLASAIKEALNLAANQPISDKDVTLILPQESFHFIRTEVPADIAPSAMNSFIKDKARSVLPIDIDTSPNDCFVVESDKQKVLTFYAITGANLQEFTDILHLIDLKIRALIPDTLALYKLFDKTLRSEKKETIMYVRYEKNHVDGYLYDSLGLLKDKKWSHQITASEKIENLLKDKADELEEQKNKLNRIILSGHESETVRQDTFTKAVGVWTNPLKRIIPTFYQEYLKLLVVPAHKHFPLLDYDVCFGAFIFTQEDKNFSLLKGGTKITKSVKSISLPKIQLPGRELMIFIASFVLSFLFFVVLTNFKSPINFSQLLKKSGSLNVTVTPTKTPLPTVTPTPAFAKQDLKIKILNGSGIVGKAGVVSDILKEKGFTEILTGNADNYDYTLSELEVKKDKQQAASMLQADLKNYVSDFKVTTLSATDSADVILIIGSDFK